MPRFEALETVSDIAPARARSVLRDAAKQLAERGLSGASHWCVYFFLTQGARITALCAENNTGHRDAAEQGPGQVSHALDTCAESRVACVGAAYEHEPQRVGRCGMDVWHARCTGVARCADRRPDLACRRRERVVRAAYELSGAPTAPRSF